MVTNVTSLLKTVKTVEDEAARGTRALESTIEAIGQEIKVSLRRQFKFIFVFLGESIFSREVTLGSELFPTYIHILMGASEANHF